jgi:hypothetical protein
MLEAGNHDAIAVDCSLVKDKDGKPAVVVVLETREGERVKWRGSLVGEFSKYAYNNLLTLGFRGALTDLSEGVGGLWAPKTVDILVDHYTSKDGKTFANVKYINEKFANQLDKNDAMALLQAAEEDFRKVKSEKGIQAEDVAPF